MPCKIIYYRRGSKKKKSRKKKSMKATPFSKVPRSGYMEKVYKAIN